MACNQSESACEIILWILSTSNSYGEEADQYHKEAGRIEADIWTLMTKFHLESCVNWKVSEIGATIEQQNRP